MALNLGRMLLLLATAALQLQVNARDACPAYGEIANTATVASFSMERYAGKWFEIESTRLRFVTDTCKGSSYEISPNSDGTYNDNFRCIGEWVNRDIDLTMTRPEGLAAQPGELNEKIFGVPEPYWVIDVEEEPTKANKADRASRYKSALVYSCVWPWWRWRPSEYIYFLDRSNKLSPATRTKWVNWLKAHNVSTATLAGLKKVNHTLD